MRNVVHASSKYLTSMPTSKIKQVSEGEDYEVRMECVINVKGWERKSIRFPIEVSRTPQINVDIRDLVQGYFNEKVMEQRTPQDWLDVIKKEVPEGKYRTTVGCIAWWDHVPDFKIAHYHENFARAHQSLVDIYCAATDTRAVRAELKSKGLDHWDLPRLIINGDLEAKLPESLWGHVGRLKTTHSAWQLRKENQRDWNRIADAYIYNNENIVACREKTLIKYLEKVGYPHAKYRIGKGEGWKKKTWAKIKTKWTKTATILALKPDIQEI